MFSGGAAFLFGLVFAASSESIIELFPENQNLAASSKSIIALYPENQNPRGIDRVNDHLEIARDDSIFCDSWRFSVETNDAGKWKTIPQRCVQSVKDYMEGEKYSSDLEIVAEDSLAFARSVNVRDDGKDAWIFDIDETLLSNLRYYEIHGFGSVVFDEKSFDDWAEMSKASAVASSLKLYRTIQQAGFKIFLLTGRSEVQRNATEKNLETEGYGSWDLLILRNAGDKGLPAVVYKSMRRRELEREGYRIQGNSGDQWSDLLGFAIARRSFKLPNPMYYIP